MKKNLLLILGASLLSHFSFAQEKILVLQPNGELGKDAYVHSYLNDENLGVWPEMLAGAWTHNGDTADYRSYIDFDLSQLPEGSEIKSAKLSLYASRNSGNGTHSTQSGSNESILQKVTSSWEETAITWDNQPSSDTTNQIMLAASTEDFQDFTDIDVTLLVKDMRENPENSHGFMLKLKSEQHYRRLLFATSDNDSTNLHPKLEITYECETSTCFTLKPGAELGKDAYVHSYLNDQNLGVWPEMLISAWTHDGTPAIHRALLDFDLTQIPAGSTIDSAYLSLFAYKSPSNGTHSTSSGSNEAWIQRVTSNWSEETVVWDNQPSTTDLNQVTLPGSTEDEQHYLNLNVTPLVQDIADSPNDSYGFMLKLKTKEHYRRLLFATSDNDSTELHPEIKVCYSRPLAIFNNTRNELTFSVFPNPSSDIVTIKMDGLDNPTIEVLNLAGKVISRQSDLKSTSTQINVSNYTKGIYFIKVYSRENVSVKKIIVE